MRALVFLLQVIPTDKVPVNIQYVEHLDQVWVTCWNDPDNTATKTALVIRQASQPARHHTVHTQPVANHFDLVSIVCTVIMLLHKKGLKIGLECRISTGQRKHRKWPKKFPAGNWTLGTLSSG